MRATHFLNVPTFIEENPEQSGGRKSAIETDKGKDLQKKFMHRRKCADNEC